MACQIVDRDRDIPKLLKFTSSSSALSSGRDSRGRVRPIENSIANSAARRFFTSQNGLLSAFARSLARSPVRSRNARPLINAGIEQTGNRLEQKAPPRTFFHLSNFSHYREISLLLFLPFALDPQIELPPGCPALLSSLRHPRPHLCAHVLTTALGNFCADNPFGSVRYRREGLLPGLVRALK